MYLLVASLVLAFAGCSWPTPQETDANRERVHSALSTLDDAKNLDRWIVLRQQDQDCNFQAQGWTVSSLFVPDANGELPSFLERYCVLERNRDGDGDGKDDTGIVPDDPETFGEASPDMVVVAGSAAPTLTELASSTVAQVRPVPSFGALPANLARLTILDSSPTTDVAVSSVSGTSNHGMKVATLAERVIHDSNGVPGAQLTSQVAIGWSYDEGEEAFVRHATGGDIGSQADLAYAIQAAVQDWRDDATGAPLVLNLSLGWHPDAGGTEAPGAMEPPVRAVFDAMRWGRCLGVLPIVAVGNRDTPANELNRVGPLMPAAWEMYPAPTLQECEGLLGVGEASDPYAGTAGYVPLLYGISGVDVRGQDLATQRPGARTMHAAAAAHLTAFNTSKGAYMEAMSGTSASTVIVAGTAALVRTIAPNLPASDVMKVLRDSARARSTADFCRDPAGTGCGPQHLIRACEAVAHVCTISGACGAVPVCSTIPGAAPIASTPDATPPNLTIVGLNDVACGDGRAVYDVANSLTNCPDAERYADSALPHTYPQPHGEECPRCPVFLDGRVELRTASSLTDLLNETIVVHVENGDEDGTSYPLADTLTGTYNVVQLPAGALDGEVTGVRFTYLHVDDENAHSEPLYLTWLEEPPTEGDTGDTADTGETTTSTE